MDLTPEERRIQEALDRYVAEHDFRYNPDESVVARVIRGLAKRQHDTGKAYCPCRLVTGNDELDKKSICPCAYHEDEIREQGYCHCRLFVASESS